MDYVEYFGYEQTLECNILSSYCPVTSQTIVEDLGWKYIYISNCTLYGICQTGQQVTLASGWQEYGPFTLGKSGCPYNIGCKDYACFIPGIGYVSDGGSQTYCSSVIYQPDPRCEKDQCLAKVYCENTLVQEGCVNYDCNFIELQSGDIDLAKELNIPYFDYSSEELVNIVNSDKFKNRSSEHSSISLDHLKEKPNNSKKLHTTIFPNPSEGIFVLKFNYRLKEVTIKVFDLIGRVVYYSEIVESLDQTEFDLSSQSAGIYFVQLSDSLGNLVIERIIVE